MLPYAVMELRYYLGDDGQSPFEEWFSHLDLAAGAKVSVALVRLEQGNLSKVKAVGEGVQEYRIDWGPGLPGVFRTRPRGTGDLADGRNKKAPATRHRNGQGFVGRVQAAAGAGAMSGDGKWH